MKLFCSISKELLSTWKGALGTPFFLGYTQRYEVVAFFMFAAYRQEVKKQVKQANKRQRRESGTMREKIHLHLREKRREGS